MFSKFRMKKHLQLGCEMPLRLVCFKRSHRALWFSLTATRSKLCKPMEIEPHYVEPLILQSEPEICKSMPRTIYHVPSRKNDSREENISSVSEIMAELVDPAAIPGSAEHTGGGERHSHYQATAQNPGISRSHVVHVSNGGRSMGNSSVDPSRPHRF
jgi:hypothetical protein